MRSRRFVPFCREVAVKRRQNYLLPTSRENSVPAGQQHLQKYRQSCVEVPATVLKFRPREIDPFVGIEAMDRIDVPPKRRLPKHQWRHTNGGLRFGSDE